MIRVPGYGDHLEALSPGTLARHKELGAPEGFSDAIGWMQAPATRTARPAGRSRSRSPTPTTPPAAPPELGGTVLVEPFDVPYVRMAVLRDPDGVTFAIGKFQPPE